MNYFCDYQFKNVLSQFVRIFSNFKYKTGINHTGKQELLPIPCKVGNVSRIVGAITRNNSENVALTAPFISCFISNISVARNRTMNPTYTSQLQINERKYNYETSSYENELGNSYLVERFMPVPFDITMQVDIWTTNEDMKMQIIEQILVLFNPAIDFQKNENPLDWSALGTVELESINYSSRSVPVGNDDAFEITTLTFQIQHFFLNPPAKVKKQKLIDSIKQNLVPDGNMETWENNDFDTKVTTYKNTSLTIDGNEATLSGFGNLVEWQKIFYNLNLVFEPGFFRIHVRPDFGVNHINADIILNLDSLSISNKSKALVTVNKNTLPSTTLPAIDDFIDPNITYPDNGLVETIGSRYIILKDITGGNPAWGVLVAKAGSIITTNDGVNWVIDFDSTQVELGSVIRNKDDDELYVHVTEDMWVNVYQGTYRAGYWRLVSIFGS
jgi:hypothetical protein